MKCNRMDPSLVQVWEEIMGSGIEPVLHHVNVPPMPVFESNHHELVQKNGSPLCNTRFGCVLCHFRG